MCDTHACTYTLISSPPSRPPTDASRALNFIASILIIITFIFDSQGTGEKPTQVTDSVQNKHAQDAQKVNSYSKQTQLSQQKGTGERATVVADDVHTKHAVSTLFF